MERVSMEIGKFFHSNYVMGTENMEILKVVIADDEVRICQLIQALIDWDSMGMKVVGIAHNGEEACEMVRQTQPDILITDIRMPGCSGLELVKRVKELDSALEVIIISGYAHFEYAHQRKNCRLHPLRSPSIEKQPVQPAALPFFPYDNGPCRYIPSCKLRADH